MKSVPVEIYLDEGFRLGDADHIEAGSPGQFRHDHSVGILYFLYLSSGEELRSLVFPRM